MHDKKWIDMAMSNSMSMLQKKLDEIQRTDPSDLDADDAAIINNIWGALDHMDHIKHRSKEREMLEEQRKPMWAHDDDMMRHKMQRMPEIMMMGGYPDSRMMLNGYGHYGMMDGYGYGPRMMHPGYMHDGNGMQNNQGGNGQSQTQSGQSTSGSPTRNVPGASR